MSQRWDCRSAPDQNRSPKPSRTTLAGATVRNPTYPDRMLSAVRRSMACLGPLLGFAICAGCGGSFVTTSAAQSTTYNQTKSYGLTTCGDWNDAMTDSQQWLAAADILTGAIKKWDGDEDRPADSLITRFQRDITEACSVDDNHQLPEIAVGTYLIGRDRSP